ncbi:MAG: DUF4097 family beta strand repeat-containing protein [Vulcanimicrobiaceae bacterium]
MITRARLIAVLVVMEAAVVGGMVLAIRGDPAQWAAQHTDAAVASGANLAEGRAHRTFEAGAHPALTVDIGYADLTIRAGDPSKFDVSVSKSAAYGIFRAKAPITARQEGDTIHIGTNSRHHWSIGDDRMVTVLVPPQTRVIVVNAGNIEANGLRAEASFNSIGSGGTVAIEDYDAPALHVAEAKGLISLRRVVADRVDAAIDDGRIEGTALRVRDGSVETRDGRVTLGFAPGADTLVTAQTSDGGMVRVAGSPAAPSGKTASKSDDNADEVDDSTSRTVRIGNGDGRLDVHASDGDIEISQDS